MARVIGLASLKALLASSEPYFLSVECAERDPRPCGYCAGSGLVREDYCPGLTHEDDCRHCAGTGRGRIEKP